MKVYVLFYFERDGASRVLGLYRNVETAKNVGTEHSRHDFRDRWRYDGAPKPTWHTPPASDDLVMWMWNDSGYRIEKWEIEE